MTITICRGDCCHVNGTEAVYRQLSQLIAQHGLTERIQLCGAFCIQLCADGCVGVKVDDKGFALDPKKVEEFFHKEILQKM